MALRREVVEHIALRPVAKGEEAGQRHDETSDAGCKGRVVGNSAEAVDGGRLERAID